MKKYAIAYAANASVSMFTKADLTSLTHINLAFGLVDGHRLDMSQLTNIEITRRLREWNPNIKILVSVGGWGAGGFSEMA